MCVSDKLCWVVALSHVQKLEKCIKIYGSPRFRRVRIVMLSTQGRLLYICGYVHRAGKPCHHCYHITDAIESTYCEIIWWDTFIITSERILNIQERLLASSTARNWEFPIHPILTVLHSQYILISRTRSFLNGSCRVQYQS
jgi:hypothetical protein